MGVDIQPPCPAAVFAAALVAARVESGIPSQAAFARAAGIDLVEANKYERGKRMPSLLRFARLTCRAGIDPLPILAALDGLDKPKPQGQTT